MEIYEIICGAVVLLIALLIIVVCLMQDTKGQDSMTAALGGGITDSFYNQNQGNTREAALAKLTRLLGIVAFVIIIAMDIVVPLVMKLFQAE